ncbi:MAG: molybdopterin cofactor-binding domain-containing protein [Kofleriaceae bacterium]
MSRRTMLAALGWTATGLTLASCRLLPPIPKLGASDAEDTLGWLQIHADGRVELRSPVHDFGQGATTGLLQIVAEELGVAVDRISVVLPSTAHLRPVQGTFGSFSMAIHARPVAEIAAATREVLRTRVARARRVARSAVVDAQPDVDGAVFVVGASRLGLAEAVAGKTLVIDADQLRRVQTRSFDLAAPTRWVGKDVVPPDHVAVVTGATRYTSDIRLPGMAHGYVIAPPTPDAVLEAVDLGAARALSGWVAGHVDLDQGFVGVIAEDPFRLRAVIDAVRPRWRLASRFSQDDLDAALDVDRLLRRGALERQLVDDLDLDEGRAWSVNIRVDTPMVAHAPIELRAGVARWQGDRCEISVGTQDAFLTRDVFARRLGIANDHLIVHGQRMGGAFGGRAGVEGLDAAILARVARRPVKVQWTRPDDFARSFHGPPTSHRIRAQLDARGQIAAWWHAIGTGHVLLTSSVLAPWVQAATGLVPDEGAETGAVGAYRLGRRRIEVSAIRLPIPTGPWRGLNAAPNAFAIETAIDALAEAARVDPLAFRLRHLDKSSSLARCLDRVAERAGWAGRGGRGRGRAVACSMYGKTAVAVIAEVVELGGQARVERVVVAHDCGVVINPDRVRAQIEGNVIWAIGSTLRHRLVVADGRVTAQYLNGYPLPTIADTPAIEIDLVDAGRGTAWSGAGEPTVAAATAAIASAAAQALGVAPRALPVAWRNA